MTKSKFLKKAALSIISIYLSLILFLFFCQRNLEYRPSGMIGSLSSYHLNNFEELHLKVDSNSRILAWYKAAQKNHKIILYFHGNSGNLGERSIKFKTFADAGFGVLAISYNGFYGSDGKPTETSLMLDAKSAMQFLFDQGYKEKDIILFGESLGTGVAVQLASAFKVYAVILESPFSSIASVAQKKYWYAPVELILKDKFNSAKYADKILSPVLIFHGTSDKVVPYSEALNLYQKIKSPKKFITIEGGGHLKFGDQFLLDEMKIFFLAPEFKEFSSR